MRDQLFLDICDRLKNNVPELKWIDKDWQQLELPDQSYPVQFDCALISFPQIPWDLLSRNTYDGPVEVLIRIGVDMYNDTYVAGGVTSPDRAAAILKMQLVNKVHSVISGFEGDYFSKLVRTKSIEEKRNDGLLVFDEYYVTRMVDRSAATKYQDASPVTLDLSGSIKDSV